MGSHRQIAAQEREPAEEKLPATITVSVVGRVRIWLIVTLESDAADSGQLMKHWVVCKTHHSMKP